jgi:hypothetical protein
MKKSTKKTLAALVIILIFGFSSIAFIVSELAGNPQSGQLKPLNSTVVDGPVDPSLESAYIQNQYTFLKYYYSEKDYLYEYVAQLPEIMSLPDGNVQLLVVRLHVNDTNETRAEIINLNGDNQVADLSEAGLADALCQQLMFAPTDCLLQNLSLPPQSPPFNNSQPVINATNETSPQL